MSIILVLLLASTISLYKVEGCTNNIQCITETTYQFCVVSGSQTILVNGVYTCGTGTICDENGASACVEGTTSSSTSTTTTSTTTTTLATGPPDSCTQAAKYPAEACNQYWECVSVWWWFELKLQTCDTNLAYSSSLQECVADSSCTNTTTDSTTISTPTTTESTTITTPTTTESTTITTPTTTESTTTITTTTVATSIGPPDSCSQAAKYPAETCNQYWECVSVWWWFELKLQTCDTNLAYSSSLQECVADSTCTNTTDSTPISTTTTAESTTITTPTTTDSTTITTPTTTESTTTITTTVATIGPPDSCSQAAKYPAEACNQYWECVSVWWWFELKLQTCDTNLAYSSSLQECVADSTCTNTTDSTTISTTTTAESTTITTPTTTDSTTITTPTTTESTTTITTTVATIGPPDSCSQAAKYTAEACNQYWECVSVWWWFELKLQTCDTNLAYSSSLQECVADSTCTNTTDSTPISTTTTAESTTITTPTTTDSTTITTPTTTESTTTITTTVATIGPPDSCSQAAKYPAEACNQYWECVSVWWWFELKLQTCDTNLAYSSSLQECVADSTCTNTTDSTTISTTTTAESTTITTSTTTESTTVATPTTTESTTITTPTTTESTTIATPTTSESTTIITTTTVATPIGPPDSCPQAAKYLSETCYQYWECVSVWWWFEPRLQTCETDLAYSALLQTCVADISCIRPPDSCPNAGKYPAQDCNQYWECVSVWWWFELKLQTCETNLAYSASLQECVVDSTCTNTTTDSTTISTSTTTDSTTVSTPATTASTTITTTTTVTTATGPPETCTETGKYPADACDQYWECVYVMWWYELVLQTCGTDLSYNATSQECVANGTCASTTTTTQSTTTVTTTTTASTTTTAATTTVAADGPPETCTTTGKYTADACNQYWECVYVMWWYELVLQTCGTDQAYNATSQACVANSTCYV